MADTHRAGTKVGVEIEGDIAVVVVDGPPVDAGSAEVRQALLDAIFAVSGRDDIAAAVVIIGAGGDVGSDIGEFDGPLQEPQMPAVIAAIEACAKPVVAAIHGAALGGDFEIALGCDARVATADAVVGLPEVKFGIVPGAGGTQRMPRLTGIARALEIIASGRRVAAGEALAIGLVDAVAEGDLRTFAVAFARSLPGKRRLSEAGAPGEDADAIERAAITSCRSAQRSAAVAEAVAAVRMAGSMPFHEALVREREAFQRLRATPEAAALRHLFFAEQQAVRGPANGGLRRVERVGVVGLGLMGSGIAACLAAAGLEVLVAEQNEAALLSGTERVRETLRSIAKRQRMAPQALEQAVARIVSVPDLRAMAMVDLAVEVAVEDMEVKQALFRQLDGVLRPGAILASNTSYLDIDALAQATGRAPDVAGLHFFSPAHVMRLVEVVRGTSTALDVVATLVDLARRLGKIPVVARTGEGFIGNRILAAYRLQCDFVLEEGAYPEDVDAALTDFGMAMGPYAVADLAGLDIAWRTRQRQARTRDPRARYAAVADRLCEMGRLGRKTGAGWYRYDSGGRTPKPDPAVRALIDDVSTARGVPRHTIGAEQIVERAVAAMVNEACLILDAGIAERPSDIDLVLVHGYGFPATKGGLLYWAAHQPRSAFLASVARMVEASGFGARRAPGLDRLLDGIAA